MQTANATKWIAACSNWCECECFIRLEITSYTGPWQSSTRDAEDKKLHWSLNNIHKFTVHIQIMQKWNVSFTPEPNGAEPCHFSSVQLSSSGLPNVMRFPPGGWPGHNIHRLACGPVSSLLKLIRDAKRLAAFKSPRDFQPNVASWQCPSTLVPSFPYRNQEVCLLWLSW